MYKANIEFRAFEDSYTEGESLTTDNIWYENITADTKSELRNKVLETTYSKWEYLDDEQINEYEFATEYNTAYMANAENEGEATPSELEAWKLGKCRLWSVHCHIMVTEIIETKADLEV
jgi:hypothetical protein